jgi:peptidoglycan/LPS O-acetylase OafA/YrhL
MPVKNFTESLLRPGLLRLFLAIVVVLQHARICAFGSWAVYVFFVLSGYWVCRMWWEKYRPRAGSILVFYASRFWRLWPTYIVCQLIGLAVMARFSPRWVSEIVIMAHPAWIARALLIISSGSQFNYLNPIWSLDVEMQFYLVLPLLAWGVAKLFGRPVAWRTACGILALAGLFVLFVQQAPAKNGLEFLTPYLVFFGAGMAVFFSGWQPTRLVGVASATLFVLATAVIAFHPTWHRFIGSEAMRTTFTGLHAGNTILAGILALIVTPYAALTVYQPSPPLDRHLGNISYVLYLFHYPVQMAVDWGGHRFSSSPFVLAAIQLAALIAGTLVLYRCVDLPSERWRHIVLEKRRALRD